jgi:hypothetical protein
LQYFFFLDFPLILDGSFIVFFKMDQNGSDTKGGGGNCEYRTSFDPSSEREIQMMEKLQIMFE